MAREHKIKLLKMRNGLIREIALCKAYKEKTIRFVDNLNEEHRRGWISEESYKKKIDKVFTGKHPESWVKYYEHKIVCVQRKLDEINTSLEDKKERVEKVFEPRYLMIFLALLMLTGVLLYSHQFEFGPTGFVIGEGAVNRTGFNISEPIGGNVTIVVKQGDVIPNSSWVNVSFLNYSNYSISMYEFLLASYYPCDANSTTTEPFTDTDAARNWEGIIGYGFAYNNSVECAAKGNFTVPLERLFPTGLPAPALGGVYWVVLNASMNDTNETVVYNANPVYVGNWLTVNLTTPAPFGTLDAEKNMSLQVNVTVFCNGSVGGSCGQVNGTINYNLTGTRPDTQINTTIGNKPFFSLQGNLTCGVLVEGGLCQLNWTINATGNVSSRFMIDVNFTTNDSRVRINNTYNFSIVIVDTILPNLGYLAQTPANNTNTSVKSIYVNISVRELNEWNVTFTLVNTSDTVNKTTWTFGNYIREFNHTSSLLNNVTHWYNVTICDEGGNCNTTDTRTVSIDNVGPTMTSVLINATSDVDINTFVKLNASVTDLSISNVTLEVDPPSSDAYNVTPTRAANGIEYYNSTIKLTQAGQWVFRFYSNDTAGNNATRFASDGGGNLYINVIGGNTAPRIHNVTNYTLPSGGSYAPLEGDVRLFSFTFNATDAEGTSDLNPATARMEFNYSGEPLRSNYSCSQLLDDTATNTIMFNCSIEMWYFDIPGGWTINVSVADDAGEMATNTTTSFVYTSLTAMKMNQSALRWPSLFIGDTNKTANNDAEVINNTGNVNFTTVQITGYDLQGETVGGSFYNISKFTASWASGGDACSGGSCAECAEARGTTLRNNTARTITAANVTRGNNSAGNGQEDIYFCIQKVPQIPKQAYFSNISNWLLAVS